MSDASKPPRCVVTAWDDEKRAIVHYTIETERMENILAKAFPLEVPTETHNDVIDDEIARQIGGTVVKLLALSNTALKPMDQITPHPDAG
ncbi:hypothetical protein JOE11_004592 [Robbsia andropogonis]|uniref:hypothetical protein n=1 Tax=Robbsia andropogonis TaxID=28092 RepID=UPI0020A03D14|nr:hypothetical protein [Robbsia andropogonis]MCP1119998.1 hypothetical protein [Robbsia andropogonis]MCP1129943.1 hypothetical protein [Robbsia andropogonis]